MLCCVLLCGVEIDIFSCHKICALNNAHRIDTMCYPLCYCCTVILKAVRESLIFKPAACKCMAVYHNKQRIQSHSLHARAIKNCKINTSARFSFKHSIGSSDPLSLLKACRRHGVRNILLLKRSIYRTHLLFCYIRIPCLISCKGWTARPLLKMKTGSRNYLLDLGMVRSYKGCSHFRHEQNTCPLVIGKKLYSHCL